MGPWVGDLWWVGVRRIVATIHCVWLSVLGCIVDTVLSSVLLSTAITHDVVMSSASIDSVVCGSWAWVRLLLGRLVARVRGRRAGVIVVERHVLGEVGKVVDRGVSRSVVLIGRSKWRHIFRVLNQIQVDCGIRKRIRERGRAETEYTEYDGVK